MDGKNPGERLKEQKELLKKCNYFIKNEKRKWEQDLKECKAEYQEACANLESEKREYEKELQRGIAAGYSPSQMKTMTSMYEEGIALDSKYCDEARFYVEKAQEFMDQYPELLKQAQADKERFEKNIFALEQQTATKSFPLQIAGGAVIWGVIILLLMKACGG